MNGQRPHYRRGIALAEVAATSREERRNLALMRLGLAQAELAAGRHREAEAAVLPLLAHVDDVAVVVDLRAYVLLTASEAALVAGDRILAEERARAALDGLTPQEVAGSVLAAEAQWLRARALGPDAAAITAATAVRAMLQDPAIAAGCSFTTAAVDELLRQR
jgi:hypothetical protein